MLPPSSLRLVPEGVRLPWEGSGAGSWRHLTMPSHLLPPAESLDETGEQKDSPEPPAAPCSPVKLEEGES